MIQAELDFIKAIAAKHYTGGIALDVGSSGLMFRNRPKFPYSLAELFDEYVTFDRKAEAGVEIVGDAELLRRDRWGCRVAILAGRAENHIVCHLHKFARTRQAAMDGCV